MRHTYFGTVFWNIFTGDTTDIALITRSKNSELHKLLKKSKSIKPGTYHLDAIVTRSNRKRYQLREERTGLFRWIHPSYNLAVNETGSSETHMGAVSLLKRPPDAQATCVL